MEAESADGREVKERKCQLQIGVETFVFDQAESEDHQSS